MDEWKAKELLRETLLNLESIPDHELEIILQAFELELHPKKSLLCDMNQIADKVYFVCQGMLRLYTIKEDGDELTIFLAPEALFASSFESLVMQQKSKQILETLEDSILLSLRYDKLQELYRLAPSFNTVTRKIAELRFINAQRLFSSHIMDSPEQRYIRLMKEQPVLIQRVPLHILASFLGITPVSISRIRKRLQEGKAG
ncbi:MAG: Crp/Fnr family transcriptional regulator [Bacteroidetes bacterium]|nr:MAG: Crp/Fnr family transcriptional regulator [Bacteroidota bacterium]